MSHTKEQYWDHRKQGLCVICHNLALHGRTRCPIHIHSQSVCSHRIKIKREGGDRCIGCGNPLHPEMDEGHKKCYQCRTWKHMGRMKLENPPMFSAV